VQLYNKTVTVVLVVLLYDTLAAIQSGDIHDIEIWGKVTLKGENEQLNQNKGKQYHQRSGDFPFPLLDSNRYRVTSSMSWIGKSTFDVPSLALALTPLLFLSSAFKSRNGKLGSQKV
jgi:hypothetical protein